MSKFMLIKYIDICMIVVNYAVDTTKLDRLGSMLQYIASVAQTVEVRHRACILGSSAGLYPIYFLSILFTLYFVNAVYPCI